MSDEPLIRIPGRRWWQWWKPRWTYAPGVTREQIMRAHGLMEDDNGSVRFATWQMPEPTSFQGSDRHE